MYTYQTPVKEIFQKYGLKNDTDISLGDHLAEKGYSSLASMLNQ